MDDQTYEFSAPGIFNFIKELWLQTRQWFAVSRTEASTPTPKSTSWKQKSHAVSENSKTPKVIASLAKSSISTEPRDQSHSLRSAGIKQLCPRSVTRMDLDMTTDFVGENQAIKRQKLEGGITSQILIDEPLTLPHKSKSDVVSGETELSPSTAKEDRKVYVRQTAASSVAEMVKHFESRAKEKKLYVRQRAAPIISVAEMVKQFESRTREILESPPALWINIPEEPEFQEFHLKTMERPCQYTETPTILSSTNVSCQNGLEPPRLNEPITPSQEMSMQALPVIIRSSKETEQEQLEKMPKFKILTEEYGMEQEEAQRRTVKAQPIMKVDRKVRKPLTDLIDKVISADCQAVDSVEFDQKMEEARAVKELKKAMVPHAFGPKSPKGKVVPKSPNLHDSKRKERGISNVNASSNPATSMR